MGRRREASLILCLALLSTSAVGSPSAAEPSADAVLQGEDLARWSALEEDLAQATSDQLTAFILDFPDSPLTELAWSELRTRDKQARAELPRRLARRLERSWRARQAVLGQRASSAAATTVEDLDAAPQGP